MVGTERAKRKKKEEEGDDPPLPCRRRGILLNCDISSFLLFDLPFFCVYTFTRLTTPPKEPKKKNKEKEDHTASLLRFFVKVKNKLL